MHFMIILLAFATASELSCSILICSVDINCELFITRTKKPQSFLRSAVVRIDIFLPRQSNIHIMPKSAYLFHGFSAFYFTAVVEPEDQDSIVSDGNPVD